MKKLILLFCIALLCVSCAPHHNSWVWAIENQTGQTLKLKFPSYAVNQMGSDFTYNMHTLSVGDNVFIRSVTKDRKHNLHFDYYFSEVVDYCGEEVYWQILSEDDVVLKTWNYSDINALNQQFFEESQWGYMYGAGSRNIETMFVWTFEIQPEDISSN